MKSLQLKTKFARSMVKNTYHGTKSVLKIKPKIRDIMSENLKNIENLEHFKKEMKTWKFDNYTFRMCNVYIESVGFF